MGIESSKEAKAIIFDLNKAREFQLNQFPMLLDFLEVVHAIEGKEDWIFRNCVANILASVKSFVSLNFRHLSIDLNIEAHELTKFYSMFEMESEYFDSFSEWLVM